MPATNTSSMTPDEGSNRLANGKEVVETFLAPAIKVLAVAPRMVSSTTNPMITRISEFTLFPISMY